MEQARRNVSEGGPSPHAGLALEALMVKRFANDDAGYEKWIKANHDGYVYNSFGKCDPKNT